MSHAPEEVVIKYIENQDGEILDRNFKPRHTKSCKSHPGSVDFVYKVGEELRFMNYSHEVSVGKFTPEPRFTKSYRQWFSNAMMQWLERHTEVCEFVGPVRYEYLTVSGIRSNPNGFVMQAHHFGWMA